MLYRAFGGRVGVHTIPRYALVSFDEFELDLGDGTKLPAFTDGKGRVHIYEDSTCTTSWPLDMFASPSLKNLEGESGLSIVVKPDDNWVTQPRYRSDTVTLTAGDTQLLVTAYEVFGDSVELPGLVLSVDENPDSFTITSEGGSATFRCREMSVELVRR